MKLLATALVLFPLLLNAKITPLSQEMCQKMEAAGTITKDNPVPCSRLNTVSIEYRDFEGATRNGDIVVLDVFAPQTEALFQDLYKTGFPLKKAVPLEQYGGNDNYSMADNNTSGFNGRKIAGSKNWSKHAYGAAIDINPLQNPFVNFETEGKAVISPPEGAERFINRGNIRPGKDIRPGMAEDVTDIFFSRGFIRWGGYWDTPIDYQHFEVGSVEFINRLLAKNLPEARAEFHKYGESYRQCMARKLQSEDIRLKRKQCIERVQR